jgi:predicted nucleic acid-binding protein
MASYLVDTNILLRASDPGSLHYQLAIQALTRLAAAGAEVYITPQNLIEFWAVATRARDANGFGWSVAKAALEIEQLRKSFLFLEDTPDVFIHWRSLVTTYGITSKRVHDTRLVAVMLAHGVTHFLTFNTDDFKTFTNITLVHPDEVA